VLSENPNATNEPLLGEQVNEGKSAEEAPFRKGKRGENGVEGEADKEGVRKSGNAAESGKEAEEAITHSSGNANAISPESAEAKGKESAKDSAATNAEANKESAGAGNTPEAALNGGANTDANGGANAADAGATGAAEAGAGATDAGAGGSGGAGGAGGSGSNAGADGGASGANGSGGAEAAAGGSGPGKGGPAIKINPEQLKDKEEEDHPSTPTAGGRPVRAQIPIPEEKPHDASGPQDDKIIRDLGYYDIWIDKENKVTVRTKSRGQDMTSHEKVVNAYRLGNMV